MKGNAERRPDMAKMTEDELRAITDSEMRQAVGYFSGKLANQRQKAMSYYLGNAVGDLAPPEVEGRSSTISPVVRNTVESMLPQLMVKFAASEHVGEFLPNKPGDEKAAEQATDYINYLYHVRNDGERITYNWMKDALLQKNGVLKVWWDDSSEEKREEYVGLDDIELAQLMDDEEIEVIEQKTYPDEEDIEHRQEALQHLAQQLQNPQIVQNPQAVQAIQQQIMGIQSAPEKMLFDVVCKRVPTIGRVCVENVPPEEFLICRNAKSIDTARFVAHRVARTRSELKSMGYKNVDNISGDDLATAFNAERIERLAWDDEMAYISAEQINNQDESQQTLWVTECYIRADWNGDGISELRKVVRAGGEVLENVEVDQAPFVSITPVPMPHKFFGMSVADLAMESQRVETALLRGVLDNTYLQINGRYFAVEGQVNLDDLLTSRPGGVVRTKSPGAVGRLDQAAGNSELGMSMLEYMKGYNEDATGWTRYNQGSDGDSLNNTATGVNIVTNRADMRLDLIARNFAEGFRDLFRLMLKLVSQYQQKEDVVNLHGSWSTVNPREWRNGFSFSINVGLGTGSRDQQIKQLMLLLNEQKQGLAINVATPENIYQAQKELVKAIGYKSADKFFTDPKTLPPQPNHEMQQAQAELQAKMQMEQAKLQTTQQIEMQKMQAQQQVDINRQQAEAQQHMAKVQAEAELSRLESQMKAELEQQRMVHEQTMKQQELAFQQWKAQFDNETKVVLAQLQANTSIQTASMGKNENDELPEEYTADGQPMPRRGIGGLVDALNNNLSMLINSHQQSSGALASAIAQGNTAIIGEIRKPRKRQMQRSDGTILTAIDTPAED
jgi:hypothetical protein